MPTTTPTMTVPLENYLSLTSMLTNISLDQMQAGMIETATDYGMAVGAILTLLSDFGLIDSTTLKPV